jgi:hypothetical protein
MRTFLLKVAIIAFLLLGLVSVFGPQLHPLFSNFGHPEEIRTTVSSALLIAGVGALALIFVRTLLGFVLILALAVLFFILLQYFWVDVMSTAF